MLKETNSPMIVRILYFNFNNLFDSKTLRIFKLIAGDFLKMKIEFFDRNTIYCLVNEEINCLEINEVLMACEWKN